MSIFVLLKANKNDFGKVHFCSFSGFLPLIGVIDNGLQRPNWMGPWKGCFTTAAGSFYYYSVVNICSQTNLLPTMPTTSTIKSSGSSLNNQQLMIRGYKLISNLPWIKKQNFKSVSTKSQCTLRPTEAIAVIFIFRR